MYKLQLLLSIFIFFGGAFLFSIEASAQNYVVNPNQTYTYTKMIKDIEKLKKAYPELIDVKTIGKSEYGRDIYAVSLGKGTSTVFINGSHHAREWITTNVHMNMTDKYANAYKKKGRIDGYDAQKILNNSTKAGDSLSALHETLIQSVKKGKLNPSTVTTYEQLEKEILTTESKIKNIATDRVRTLAIEKYMTPVRNNVPAIDNILLRYMILVQIDQKSTNKEQPFDDWVELEKLEQQAPTDQALEPAEQFLQKWQETLKQAHSNGVAPTEVESATVVEKSAA